MSGRSISVSRGLFHRITAYADSVGSPVRQIVEQIVAPVIAGIVLPEEPGDAPAPMPKEQPMTPQEPERPTRDDILAAVAASSGLVAPVRFPVSAELWEAIEDQLDRAAARGETLSAAAVFESALIRMLDHVETLPRSRFCAICTDDIDGNARLLPLGKNESLVWVCRCCDTAHPRSGDYSYSSDRRSKGIGFGNHRLGKRGT